MLYSLKLLIAMILGGLSVDINTQACLTIAQLILFNSIKKSPLKTHEILYQFETSFSDME